MFARSQEGKPVAFPHLPATLRAHPFNPLASRECRDNRADTAEYIKPYMSLQSRLSQIWVNRWTILLLLVLMRMVFLIAQLRDNIGDAETKALSACTKVEDIGSTMASMPHYLSPGVNDLAASGIERMVHGMVDMLDLMLQGVEAIIIFFIDFLIATYTCLITALVHGSLDVVAAVISEATNDVHSMVDDATNDINLISSGLQGSINKLTSGIQDSIFGKLIPDIPKVNFSGPVDKLKSFNLSSDRFATDLQQLNRNLPTFDQVQNLTQLAISFPIENLRKALNESYGSYEFDKGAFPLAQKQQLTFCSNNDTLNNFFMHLYSVVEKARLIFIVILSIGAAATMAPMAWLEIRKWHWQRKNANLVPQHQFDPMDVVYIASRPFTATIGIQIASRFSGKRQILARWCVAYATSSSAMFVLSLAVSGFFACICQFILLKTIEKEVPTVSQEVGAFASSVVGRLQNSSDIWANAANEVIIGLNNDINHDLLDYVGNATNAVNNTLNVFLENMGGALETAFNGTVLIDPIRSVLHCVVDLNLENVQKGLAWVHDHARVDFPLLLTDTFSVGANESLYGDSGLQTFLASPSSAGVDEVSGAISHVTNWLHNSLVYEALLATGLFLMYVIVVLIGVVRTLAGMCGAERNRSDSDICYPMSDLRQSSQDTEFAHSKEEAGTWIPTPPPDDEYPHRSGRSLDSDETMAYGGTAGATSGYINSQFHHSDNKNLASEVAS